MLVAGCWLLVSEVVESSLDGGEYGLYRLIAVDLAEASLIAVVLDNRCGLGVEGLHALGKNFFGVVGALDERGAIDVTYAGDCRRIAVDIVDASGGRDTAAGDAVEELLVVDDDADRNDWRRCSVGCQLRVEPLSLIQGSRKSVEDITVRSVGLSETIGNHLVDEIIRNQLPFVHDSFGGVAECSAEIGRAHV